MSRRFFANFSVALLVCSVQPLSQLSAFPGEPASRMTLAAQGVPGTYELTLFKDARGGITEITDLNPLFVNEELVLWAHVEDSSGVPASSGSVTFQVCRHGRTDPRPSSDCDIGGTARWVSLITMKVTAETCLALPQEAHGPGNACVDFGFVANPRTIGFRFRYTGQGSGIAGDISDSKDATWNPLP
jgi:hypothetical protein